MLMYILTLNFGRDARALARQNKKVGREESRAEKTDGRRQEREDRRRRRRQETQIGLSAPVSSAAERNAHSHSQNQLLIGTKRNETKRTNERNRMKNVRERRDNSRSSRELVARGLKSTWLSRALYSSMTTRTHCIVLVALHITITNYEYSEWANERERFERVEERMYE